MTQDSLMQRMILAGVNILNPQEVFDFYHSQSGGEGGGGNIDLEQLKIIVNQWIETAIAEKASRDELAAEISIVNALAETNQLNITTKADHIELEQTNQQVELNRLALLGKADLTALAMLTALLNTKADQQYVNEQIANLLNSDEATIAAIQEIANALQENEDLLDALEYTVANRVRFDIATQALTALQKSNARANIGAEEQGTAAMLIAQITVQKLGAATAAQGVKADTALQGGDVAPVAFTGLFSSLGNQNKIFDVVHSAYISGTAAAITASDTLGQMLAKLQAQINNPPVAKTKWMTIQEISDWVNPSLVVDYTTTRALRFAVIGGMLFAEGQFFLTNNGAGFNLCSLKPEYKVVNLTGANVTKTESIKAAPFSGTAFIQVHTITSGGDIFTVEHTQTRIQYIKTTDIGNAVYISGFFGKVIQY